MKYYLKATKLLNNIISYANDIENVDIERESKLSTLHNYYNDIAKMLYLDAIDITRLEEIEKLFKTMKKQWRI